MSIDEYRWAVIPEEEHGIMNWTSKDMRLFRLDLDLLWWDYTSDLSGSSKFNMSL